MAVTALSRPSRFPEDEWQARVDLAACYRLFVRYGWTDLIYTHLTARVPGTTDQYLINPYGLMFDEITASSLLKVDFDGNLLEGEYPLQRGGSCHPHRGVQGAGGHQRGAPQPHPRGHGGLDHGLRTVAAHPAVERDHGLRAAPRLRRRHR